MPTVTELNLMTIAELNAAAKALQERTIVASEAARNAHFPRHVYTLRG
jgi:hypothetical protein